MINYELASDIFEEHLLKVENEIVKNWMRKLHGFIKGEIYKK